MYTLNNSNELSNCSIELSNYNSYDTQNNGD